MQRMQGEVVLAREGVEVLRRLVDLRGPRQKHQQIAALLLAHELLHRARHALEQRALVLLGLMPNGQRKQPPLTAQSRAAAEIVRDGLRIERRAHHHQA
jgi:hypothetical protein